MASLEIQAAEGEGGPACLPAWSLCVGGTNGSLRTGFRKDHGTNRVGPEIQAPPRQSGHLRAQRILCSLWRLCWWAWERWQWQGHMASREPSADRDFPLPSPSPRHSLGSLWGVTEERCHFAHSTFVKHMILVKLQGGCGSECCG